MRVRVRIVISNVQYTIILKLKKKKGHKSNNDDNDTLPLLNARRVTKNTILINVGACGHQTQKIENKQL